MASSVSTQPASGADFPADFLSNIGIYQQRIRRHRLTAVARQFHLHDDLEQIALLELARVARRTGGLPASDHPHFHVVLSSRVSNSLRLLKRQHREIANGAFVSIDDHGDGGDEPVEQTLPDQVDPDTALDSAMRNQAAAALRSALLRLTARQREVIELVLEDLTDAEIASRLGVTVQAVNKTRLLAIGKLKQLVPTEHAIH